METQWKPTWNKLFDFIYFSYFPFFEATENSTGNISYKFIWMFYYDLFTSGNILLKEIK